MYWGKSIKWPEISRNCALPFFLIAASVLVGFIGDEARSLLQFDRQAILLQKEWWRLFSAHLVHDGWMHLLLNSTALVLIWILTGAYMGRRAWWSVTLFSMLFISIFFLLWMPELQWYMGLSGVLHALFAAGVVAGIRRHSKEAFFLALFLIAKIVWETMGGGSLFLSGESIVTQAHLYGVLLGAFVSLLLIVKK